MSLNRLRLQAILSSQARKKNLPYLCELEYLESTGEQWITIPYKIVTADTFRHETAQYYTNTSGNQYEGQTSSGNWFGISSGGKYTIGGGVTSSFTASTSSFDNIVAESDKTGLTLIVNGNVIGTRETKSSGNRIRIFDCESTTTTSYNCYIRKKYHKLYVNGSLFFDGIPVLDYDMRPAMYDRVTKKLFYNEGTGADFKYGRQIHYCDCIIGFGEEYIDTGFSPDSNTSFEAIFTKHSTTTKAIFGSRRLYQQDSYCVSFMNTGGLKIDYGTSAVTTDFKVVNKKIRLKKEKEKNYIDGNEYTANKVQTFSVVPTFLLFSVQNADGTTATKGDMALYMTKLWDNNVLVRDYKPAYDENGVAFMFDRVTHTIYDNAGTGAFKAGFEDKQGNLYTSISYLESTGSQQITLDFSVTASDSFRHETEQMYTKITGDQLEGNATGGGWFGCRGGIYKPSTFDVVPSTSSFDKIVYNCVNNRASLTVNDVQLSDSYAKVETTGFRIFNAYSAYSASYYCSVRKKYHRFYINNKLKFAGVPVINADGKPAMFDTVTKKPFYNDGTGTDFIVGE